MEKRTIRRSIPAQRDDIADLVTYRALPTALIDRIDPFLFLNHHGPQTYPRDNQGLPFGPHPHRGFETVTFILEGDIAHRDSGGHDSVIDAGGVQWMTAGRGLVHSETSSPDFLRDGGPMEILQLWVHLPARLKMTDPRYIGLQAPEIPVIEEDGGRVRLQLVSGEWKGQRGAIAPLTDVAAMVVHMQPGAALPLRIAPSRNVFLYAVRGAAQANGVTLAARHLADVADDGEAIDLLASDQGALLLLCHAPPIGEPVVAHGPFVMNTVEEIRQAITDYQAGRFNG